MLRLRTLISRISPCDNACREHSGQVVVIVGEELHVDRERSLAFARLATAAGLIETEMPRPKVANLRIDGFGEKLADLVEDLQVGRRVAARTARINGS